VQPASHRFTLHATTAINPSNDSHAATTSAIANKSVTRTEMSSLSNSTSLRSTDGPTLASKVTTVSEGGINYSATNVNRISMSLATFTTGDISGATKSTAASSTVTPSNSIVIYSTSSAAVLPSDNSSINSTMLFPTGITLTSPMVKQDSPTTNSNPIQHTTEQNHNFSNTATASSNLEDTNEEKTSKAGIIIGVIVGIILGSMLIGLIGYFVCGKKRSESFSHRRLYDDTRNDPVLHLDNSHGPYDTSFGHVSHDNTSTADKAEEANAGSPSDGIPMDDMTPSQSSP
ncbi:MUC15 protein, partial [Aegotheles bennettii]|nr:MUC15 protein [Aegotheles bennettii]